MAKRIPTQFIVAAFTTEDAVDKVEREIMDMEFEAKQVCTEHSNMTISILVFLSFTSHLLHLSMTDPVHQHGHCQVRRGWKNQH